MTTKTQVAKKAKAKGCYFEVEGNYVDLHPPVGYTLGEYHTVLREALRGYESKADIYDELLDLLDDLRRCEPNCPNC